MGIAISLNLPASTPPPRTRNDVSSNDVGTASQYAPSNVTDPPRPNVRTTVVVVVVVVVVDDDAEERPCAANDVVGWGVMTSTSALPPMSTPRNLPP